MFKQLTVQRWVPKIYKLKFPAKPDVCKFSLWNLFRSNSDSNFSWTGVTVNKWIYSTSLSVIWECKHTNRIDHFHQIFAFHTDGISALLKRALHANWNTVFYLFQLRQNSQTKNMKHTKCKQSPPVRNCGSGIKLETFSIKLLHPVIWKRNNVGHLFSTRLKFAVSISVSSISL